jgi:hypothetical protein
MPESIEFDPFVELACEAPDVISQLRLTGDVSISKLFE